MEQVRHSLLPDFRWEFPAKVVDGFDGEEAAEELVEEVEKRRSCPNLLEGMSVL